MTTLEIKRLDSLSSPPPIYNEFSKRGGDSSSNNSSGISSPKTPTQTLPQLKLQQKNNNSSLPASESPNQTPTASTSSSPSFKKLNDYEIPITIVKSPSYSNQIKKHIVVVGVDDNDNQDDDDVVISKDNLVNKNNNSHSSTSSFSNLTNGIVESASLNAVGGDPNNPNGDSTDTNALTFNKYGFVQPVVVANLNNLDSNSRNNLNSRDSSLLKANGDVKSKSNSTLSRTGGGKSSNNNSTSLINQNGMIRASTQSMAITNLKDYIQNTDVEEFSEKIPIKVIQLRELKWLEMLINFDEWMKKRYTKILSRSRKGIPQSMRSKAWLHLTGVFLLKEQSPKSHYEECLQNKRSADITRYVEDIKKDLHRQFPSHEIFMKKEGRQMLFNVLRAYAAHNPEVGYCQAQGPIAALLLMHMPEEDAFWMLIRISDFYLKAYFKPGLEQVQIDGHALYYLFKKENKAAYKLMDTQGIDPILYMTEWFMCIFARTLPWCTVLRVWDMFFCEGIKVLYRVGLYLLLSAFEDKAKFLKCQQQGMYETLNALKNLPIECLKEETLVAKSNLIRVTEDDLKKAFEKSKVKFSEQTRKINERRKEPIAFVNNNKTKK
jgi:hypothetical protein